MVTKTVYLTPEGKAALEQELDQLLKRRQTLLQRIQEERDFGAFAEGGEPDLQAMRVPVPGVHGGEAEVLFKHRGVAVREGAVVDHFAPWEVHCYRTAT